MNSRKRCVVVIPTHKSDVSVEEERSFRNTLSVLRNWDIRLVVPENVSVESYTRIKSNDSHAFDIVQVTAQWMGTIPRYNAMMLSTDFYHLFEDYDYILICHLDSWVFRDELEYWINLRYDYIGPPLFLLKEPARNSLESLVAPQGGNGGFCLRNIDSTMNLLSNARYDLNVTLLLKGINFLIRNRKFDLLKIFLRICRETYKDPVRFQLRYNVYEDVMISVCYALLHKSYKVAPPEIAMQFATEVYSEEIIQTKLKLRFPFAVHGYGKYFSKIDEFTAIRDDQRRNIYSKNNPPSIDSYNGDIRPSSELRPLVTIVTATYNIVSAGRVESFRQCIESIHSQDYDNYEHIIIDGSSSDGTLDIINEYVERGWCVCFSEPDSGVWEALRKGQERANGKYINYMNSDDFFSSPKAISIAVNSMMAKNADWFYSEGFIMRQDGTIYNFPTDVYGVFNCLGILHQTMFVRTDILRALDPFASDHVTRENYFMMLLCINKMPFSYSPERLVTYREGGFSSVDYSREGGAIASLDFAKYFHRIAGRHWGMSESECLSMHGWRCFSKEYGERYAWDLSDKLAIKELRESFRLKLSKQLQPEGKRRLRQLRGKRKLRIPEHLGIPRR
jgi:glycosyltransferase involved in cell wall biosynthesis